MLSSFYYPEKKVRPNFLMVLFFNWIIPTSQFIWWPVSRVPCPGPVSRTQRSSDEICNIRSWRGTSYFSRRWTGVRASHIKQMHIAEGWGHHKSWQHKQPKIVQPFSFLKKQCLKCTKNRLKKERKNVVLLWYATLFKSHCCRNHLTFIILLLFLLCKILNLFSWWPF